MTSDEALMLEFQGGSREAFEELFARYRKPLYGFFARRLNSPDRAEDLTQEIFIKIFRTLHAYKPELGSFETWMMRVGRNCIIDQYRKAKVERSRTDSLSGAHGDVMETADRSLFRFWTDSWKDLVSFEIIELGDKP